MSVSVNDVTEGMVLLGSQFSEPMRVIGTPTTGDGYVLCDLVGTRTNTFRGGVSLAHLDLASIRIERKPDAFQGKPRLFKLGTAPDRGLGQDAQATGRATGVPPVNPAQDPRALGQDAQPRRLGGWRTVEEKQPPIEVLRPFYYWITALAEPLLYRFVTTELIELAKSQDPEVPINETVSWIRNAVGEDGKTWTPTVRLRVARGMLAALRDFGILEDAIRKRVAPQHLPVEAFCLIVFCLHQLGVEPKSLVRHPDWRLFLLSPTTVERLVLEAHRSGWLDDPCVGAIYRIDFEPRDLDDCDHDLFERCLPRSSRWVRPMSRRSAATLTDSSSRTRSATSSRRSTGRSRGADRASRRHRHPGLGLLRLR